MRFDSNMEDLISKGQALLIEKVINQGICVGCGACVGLCPYFHYFDGKVVVTDRCSADTWRCLQLCPRANYEETSPQPERITGGNEEIGPHRDVIMARAKDKGIRKVAQYGGVVSSILIYALEKGYIKSAVLTDSGNNLSPAGTLAANRSDVLECAGSRYSASGGLSAMNNAINAGQDRLGIVGLPCQMEALARMRLMKPDGEEMDSRIALRIGLFCTWAIDYRGLEAFLKTKDVKGDVKKFDIPPPPAEIFQVVTENGQKDFALSDIRHLIQKGCTLCQDMTAEMADISVGTVEGQNEWNTVIIRTDRGAELFNSAVKNGRFETNNLPEENLEHLREASRNKRQRGQKAELELLNAVKNQE
jgi:coenzyme F420 hydrogenase subunit beta